jgi:hypothetical protein
MKEGYCFPTLSVTAGLRLKQLRLEAKEKNDSYSISELTVNSYVVYEGNGIDVTKNLLEKLQDELFDLKNGDPRFNKVLDNKDRNFDIYEGLASGTTHRILKDLPSEILINEGFWRYVANTLLFELIVWRHPTLGNNNFGLEGGRQFLRCFPYRMFIRGDIAYRYSDGENYDLAHLDGIGQDQWASHVIAQTYSCQPELVSVLLNEFKNIRKRKVKGSLKIDRQIAKDLKLAKSVIAFDFFKPDLLADNLNPIFREAERKITEFGD